MTGFELRRFHETDYPVYAAWFVDPELNRRLGPMDQAWLDARDHSIGSMSRRGYRAFARGRLTNAPLDQPLHN